MKTTKAEELELTISRFLKIGVLLSAAVMLIGLLMFLITGNSGYAGDIYPTNPLLILAGVAALKPYAIIMTGLFILILTPVVRVGVSIIVFLKEKDYTYVAISGLVFIILIISFLIGKAE